jgi:L-threonylcarbamoyladenylate synthase
MPVDLVTDWLAIQFAARKLEEGGLVAFPTETVYGLGADAENPSAIAGIYAAKGRPLNHPVIVHLPPEANLGYWADAIPPQAQQLIDAFWPGPLTLILKRAKHIPAAVSAAQDSIGLRCPSHPVAQALLREFKAGKGGIAAPSANKFGHISPTMAQHVRDEFGSEPGNPVDCILDGGQSQVGIESTILDLSRMETHGPVLLRPGQLDAARIAEVIGVLPSLPDAAAPRVSGALDSHYAPRTPVALIAPDQMQEVSQRLSMGQRRFALMYCSLLPDTIVQRATARIKLSAMPDGFAHDLYAALRRLDAINADIILIEAPPEDSGWQAVNDRLSRAAFGSADALKKLF